MIKHTEITTIELHKRIRQKKFSFAGNEKLKIYGKLNCSSGKRMKKINRVFFTAAKEAIKFGYRPCSHCMKAEYKKWKDGLI
jgi:methylphosphotriester-DNA--protein-cysteine methyltransferase